MPNVKFIKNYKSGVVTIHKGALAFQEGAVKKGQATITVPDWGITLKVPADHLAEVGTVADACAHAVGDQVVARASAGVPAGTPGVVRDVQSIGGECFYRVDFGAHGVWVVTDADLQ